MGRFPDWAKWTIIAAAVLLSPVLAFLSAIAVEIVLGVMQDAGVLKFVALATVGVVGWSWCRKLWVQACGRIRVET
jgi:amino acid transporter